LDNQSFNPLITFCEPSVGQGPAFGVYFVDPTAGIARALALFVVALAEHKISAITSFNNTAVIARFGLPRTLPS
jgi:RNA polymerase sigma-70 factor (ECF subfamily)